MREPSESTTTNNRTGDEKLTQLLAVWVDDHADALYRFAVTRVKDQHTVEDLLQETYLAALKSTESFRRESSTRTWLTAILRLKIIDHYRWQEKTKALDNSDGLPEVASRREQLKAWDCDASQTLEEREFWEVFRTCVAKLPATLARAFSLRELDGCTPEQICELLEISHENLAVRVFRARSLLRDCLDQHWFSKE